MIRHLSTSVYDFFVAKFQRSLLMNRLKFFLFFILLATPGPYQLRIKLVIQMMYNVFGFILITKKVSQVTWLHIFD